eukprot:2368698-Rhodomonas_salina.3
MKSESIASPSPNTCVHPPQYRVHPTQYCVHPPQHRHPTQCRAHPTQCRVQAQGTAMVLHITEHGVCCY